VADRLAAGEGCEVKRRLAREELAGALDRVRRARPG
jgi:hypothetical protein